MGVDQEIPEFGTSNNDVDMNYVDHSQLSMLIFEYIDCLAIERCPYTCNMVLKAIECVARKHFTEEEEVMLNCNFEPYLAHKASHNRLLAYINGLIYILDQATSIDEIDAPSVVQFLIKWFSYHSYHEDSILLDYLKIGRHPH